MDKCPSGGSQPNFLSGIIPSVCVPAFTLVSSLAFRALSRDTSPRSIFFGRLALWQLLKITVLVGLRLRLLLRLLSLADVLLVRLLCMLPFLANSKKVMGEISSGRGFATGTMIFTKNKLADLSGLWPHAVFQTGHVADALLSVGST